MWNKSKTRRFVVESYRDLSNHRLEGHSKLTQKLNDHGIVERGNWLSMISVRGIEKLTIGKTMEQVPKIASKVCGVCPVAHTLAGFEAMEVSIGCEILRDAKLPRG